jgi:hypothetical protein
MGPLIFSRIAVFGPLAWDIKGPSPAKRAIDNIRTRKISGPENHVMLSKVAVFIIHLQDMLTGCIENLTTKDRLCHAAGSKIFASHTMGFIVRGERRGN